jgi:hypothetical protein
VWALDLAVLRVIAVKAERLETLGPTVASEPPIHAGASLADLLPMLRTRSSLDVIDGQEYGPMLSAALADFAVLLESLELYV